MRLFLAMSLIVAAGCDQADPALANVQSTEATLCAAVRGNGPRLTAHYASLARIVETYGPLHGIAGGSSGSITSFLVDSMHQNPLVGECGQGPCDLAQQRARLALLLKSFPGYIDALGDSDEALAFGVVSEIAARVQGEGVAGLLDSDPPAGVEALRTLLTSEDLRDLVNPELLELLESSADPVWHARDLVQSLAGGLSFSVDDPIVFVRPGVVSFPALADKLGRIGTFYAAWEPVDTAAMRGWLDACAPDSVGLTWAEARALPMGETTCGAAFVDLVTRFRADWASSEYPSRVDESVGSHLHALVTTSVLTGNAVEAFTEARDTYRSGVAPQMPVSFDDVSFGYWGHADDLARLTDNSLGFDDPQTKRRLSLGTTTWRQALSLSPAEPGLSRAVEIDDAHVSAGGWSDLFPVRALQTIGCDEVVYVTRRVPTDDGFAVDVATLLGMDQAERAALYSFDEPASAVNVAVEDAGAVWCTDWDRPELTDVDGIFADGYSAPMEIHTEFFDRDYENGSERIDIRGCTPNLTAE